MDNTAHLQQSPAGDQQSLIEHSPLTRFALKGLEHCWLPQHQRWSHAYHLDGRSQPNQSIPESDTYYTLNVLLGLARTPGRDRLGYDISAVLQRNARGLLHLPVPMYAYGMALWSAAELGLGLDDAVMDRIRGLITEQSRWQNFRGQDLGLILTGVARHLQGGWTEWAPHAANLFDFLCSHYAAPSGLFHDAAQGYRRNFGSFATQTYLTIACYAYAEASGDNRALELAKRATAKLIQLQGPMGEWPWFYCVPGGRVVDFYEIYSVHQDGMAPAFLEYGEKYDVPGARTALIKGFNWIYGNNELGVSMLRPELGMIIRSQVRRGELHTKAPRIARALLNTALDRSSSLVGPKHLELRRECRSYHLGWILWSFAGRGDVNELTHHPALKAAFGEMSVMM